MDVDFWIDPICPWCWLTSRWIVDVAPERDLNVTWRPISLLFKNELTSESPYFDKATHTLGLLRVLEAVKSGESNDAVDRLYSSYGQHIHEEGDYVDADVALIDAGIDTKYAEAFDDATFDAHIKAEMAEGLALTGDDVGTPIIGFDNAAGKRVAFFGPVISRRLPLKESLDLWDGMMLMGRVDSFWELKRTRTESPHFDLVK
jgi:2-hydroxychromene-2-carboxylate isomerase